MLENIHNNWLICFLFICACVTIPEAQTVKPNIVFIMADDLGYGSLNCYGNSIFETPNIDNLAGKGMRFTDFHANPFCTPTRAAFLTGRYPERCKWVPDSELSPIFAEQRRKNIKQRWAWGQFNDEPSFANTLKKGGYKTALIGKWHLGYDFKFHPMNYGFDFFKGYIAGAVDYHTHISTSGKKELDWWNGKEIKNEEGYVTDLLTEYALDFIKENKNNPFVLYLAHEAVHTPLQVRDENSKKSDQELYLEMTQILDESVGKIMETVDECNIADNTLIIFCSDNGPQRLIGLNSTGGLKGVKGSVYEGGHRTPFIAYWKGKIAKGSVCNQTISIMDMFPTFASVTHTDLPENIKFDGVDITNSLFDKGKIEQRILHWEMDGSWAVRKESWKLIGEKNGSIKLFDLSNDVEESNDISGQHPNIVEELHSLHNKWIVEVNKNNRINIKL